MGYQMLTENHMVYFIYFLTTLFPNVFESIHLFLLTNVTESFPYST